MNARPALALGLRACVALVLIFVLRISSSPDAGPFPRDGALEVGAHRSAPLSSLDAGANRPGRTKVDDSPAPLAHESPPAEPEHNAETTSDATVTIVGRVLQPDGSLLASTAIGCRVVGMTPSVRTPNGRGYTRCMPFQAQVSTSIRGEFEIHFERPKAVQDTIFELSVNSERRRASAWMEDLRDARIDVGALTLRDESTLLSGTVVDTKGEGIPGVFISVADRSDPYGSRALRFGGFPKTTTDEQGRFALRGFTDAKLFALWASHLSYAPMSMEGVEVPAEGMRIVLQPSTLPYITLRLRSDADCAGILRPVVESDKKGAEGPFPFQPIGEGRFEVHGLTEGPWRVRILVADQTVMTLEEVLVPMTGPCMDPRLDPVDVRGLVECLRFEIVDAAGRPKANASIATTSGANLSSDAQGMVTVVRPPGTRTIVLAQGGRQVIVEDGQQVIVEP